MPPGGGDRRKRKHLKETLEKVRVLSLATPRARKQLVREGDKRLVDCISECCLNVLKGNVPLTARQKKLLRRHACGLRAVAGKSVGLAKKKAIIQKGGFLGAVLAPVASLLGSLLFGGGG